MPDSETLLDVAFWGACAAGCALALRGAWKARHGAAWRSGVALSLATLLALFAAAEAVARLQGEPSAHGLALLGHPLDPYTGWKAKELRGDAASTRRRALIIGDSFTLAGVPEDDVYYRPLERELGMELWVFAAGGWGTLQEYLVLEREIDRVRPDLIVLQTCANDFLNNSWELESGSVSNNNMSRRPYWEQGRVVWRYPGRGLGWLRFFAARSALVRLTAVRLHRSKMARAAQEWLQQSEGFIHQQGTAYAPFARAVGVTDELIGRFVRRAAGVPVVAVPADAFEPYAGQWRDILARHRVALLEAGLERVRRAHAAGEDVYMHDGLHWNPRGQRYVAEALLEWLTRPAAARGVAAAAQDRAVYLVDLGGGRLVTYEPGPAGVLLRAAGATGTRPPGVVALDAGRRLLGVGGNPALMVTQDPEGRIYTQALTAGKPAAPPRPLKLAAPTGARLAAVGDLDGDGQADLVWHNPRARVLRAWWLHDGRVRAKAALPAPPEAARLAAAADFDADGRCDLLWRFPDGRTLLWYLGAGGRELRQAGAPQPAAPIESAWQLLGAADVPDGPPVSRGVADLLWRSPLSGRVSVWYLDRQARRVTGGFLNSPG